MTEILDAVVFGLAAHRATRLITKDTITEKARDSIVRWAYGDPHDTREVVGKSGDVEARDGGRWTPEGGWSLYAEQDPNAPLLATLLTCRWCASVWLTAGLLVLSALFPRPARWLRFLLAGSSVADDTITNRARFVLL